MQFDCLGLNKHKSRVALLTVFVTKSTAYNVLIKESRCGVNGNFSSISILTKNNILMVTPPREAKKVPALLTYQ